VDLRIPRLVVLLDACVHAAAAPDTSRDVETVPEQNTGKGFGGRDLDLLTVIIGILFFQAGDDLLHVLGIKLLEMFLEKGLPD
jgi:hypothetical protein